MIYIVLHHNVVSISKQQQPHIYILSRCNKFFVSSIKYTLRKSEDARFE